MGCDARAGDLGTRSIKNDAKLWAIDLAISMIDLTTLEGSDTAGKVRGLCAKALTPDASDLSTPRQAAVCVYGDMVPVVREALADRLADGRMPARACSARNRLALYCDLADCQVAS